MNHNAIQPFVNALGTSNVIFDAKRLSEALHNTLGVSREVPAILYPSSVSQVAEIVGIANEHKTPLYPISTGRNMGYGDKAPVQDGNVIVDLSRMNAIRDFDEALGHIILEPGVTQAALHDFLVENNVPFWMDATGSGYDSSIVGNALDGGFGHTPKGNKRESIFDLEIVCGNGTILKTGDLQGFGPDLRGLFVQSNFGIVTALKTELMPVPERYESFVFKVLEDRQLEALINVIRKLRQNQTLTSLVHVANATRSLITTRELPKGYQERLLTCEDAVKIMSSPIVKVGYWTAIGGLYGSAREVQAKKAVLKEAVKGIGKVAFFSDGKIRKLSRLKILGRGMARSIESLAYIHGLGKGVPNDMQVKNIKWRVENPDDMGLLFFAPNVTAEGKTVRDMVSTAEGLFRKHGFEFAITITYIRPEQVAGLMNIGFDKRNQTEKTRAFGLYQDLKEAFARKDIYPYRHHIEAMSGIRYEPGKRDVLAALKKAFDPNNIIAPGRYGV
ncbi:MAG: FAD-binding oxidoreductase [Deltaproteobacteria bacterium]|nr:FAD-binding oxidoreductase [Deltaproteobacteria bacterium]